MKKTKKQIPPIRLEIDKFEEYINLKERFEKEENPPVPLTMSGWGGHVIKKGLEKLRKELDNK